MVAANPLQLDPVLDALAHAPVGDEDLTPDELAEVERRAADLASGRVAGVAHGDVQRGLAGMGQQADEAPARLAPGRCTSSTISGGTRRRAWTPP